jgi:indolepyruvate decarboxylase
MTMQATSVVDYIVQRLADESITHCFGVPGDYAFPVCDAVERSPKVRWIGCANELNASYAADINYLRYKCARVAVPMPTPSSARRIGIGRGGDDL